MNDRLGCKILGLFTTLFTILGNGRDAEAALLDGMADHIPASHTLDEKPMLFIDAGSADAARYLLAAHRSHSSHRSHKSHYSSRGGGGGYSRPAPLYSPPAPSTPKNSVVSPQSPASSRGASTGTAAAASAQYANLVQSIQEGLTKLGYTPGPADGQLGKSTKKAIAMFQADQGLSINGEPSQALLTEIQNELTKK